MNLITRTGILGATLLAMLATPAHAGRYANIQPGYVVNEQRATARLEGETDVHGVNAYGFIDMDATHADPLDMENVLCSGRLTGPGYRWLRPFIKYEGGNGMNDVLRPGIMFKPDLGKNTILKLRYSPFSTNGTDHAEINFSQKIGDFRAGVYANRNTANGKMYVEPEISFKINDEFTAFAQGRGAGKLEKIQPAVLGGFKYTF